MREKNRLRIAVVILSVELMLIVPSCLFQKQDKGVKSTQQYWKETGLDSHQLEKFLAPQNCTLEQKKFLACVNAVNSMAEKLDLTLNLDGKLKPLTSDEYDYLVNEKRNLERWIPIFQKNQAAQYSFLDLWKQIDQRLDNNNRSYVISSGINGFLSVAVDPHTYIIPIAMYEDLISGSQAKQDKAGFVFRRSNGHYVVKKVFEGSPAEKAGLKPSDKILEVNGRKITSMAPFLVFDSLKMKDQERLGLLVERKGIRHYFEILKSEMTYPSVTSKFVQSEKRWGFLQIHRFASDSCAATQKNLISLIENGAQGILIDLRDNPGGQLDEAACIANLFLPKGTKLFETRYLDVAKTGEKYFADHDMIYRGPVAVLINSGSASASEILAGTLKDHQRAMLVGERSFGKGSFQDGSVWDENSKIALFQTQGLYYFPSGWTPQLVGLEPDLPVDFDNSEQQREQNLYYSPVVPRDAWSGPQTLAWLNQERCGKDFTIINDDPQIGMGQNALECEMKRPVGEAQ